MSFSSFWKWLDEGIITFLNKYKTVTPPVTQQDAPTEVLTPNPTPMTTTPISTPSTPKYDWSTSEAVRHSIRVICDEEGLTLVEKNNLSATIHCESGYKNIIHPNMVNGTVSTTDYGFFQINDWWHIGKGKDFPTYQYVLDNPEAVCRWVCHQWKAGNAKAWVCYAKGMYLNYSA